MTVRAILTRSQEHAFRELCNVEGDVETRLHGCSKRVLLSIDRVFLFPRDHTAVENLEREAAALDALDACAYVPRLIARWQDERISPYPFLELTRVAGAPFYGEVYEAAEISVALDLMAELGTLIAQWHERSTKDLAPILGTAFPRPPGFLKRALTDDPAALTTEAAGALGLAMRTDWIDAVAAAQSLSHVLTHGDVHGEQLIIDEGAVTGVIDWETAAVDNPLWDFNFHEWGSGWYRAHEPDFVALRERLWTSYAAVRTVPVPDWQTVHRFFCLVEAWHCVTSGREFAITRRPIALANLVDAPT